MSPEWKKLELLNCIIKNNIGRNNQINASEIKEVGAVPVIDQGHDFIAGYSDRLECIINNGFPYIIFGDHTRCFKYIDFPFIIGADGTKVLSPNKELFEPRFFYFQLLSINIPSRGYNRHYKLLTEKHLLIPPLPEQHKIAHVLSTIEKAIEQQDKLIRTTTELKKALMQKLFTEGTKGEKQKQTEIGLVPESWVVKTIGAVADVTSGGTPSRSEKSYWFNGKIPWIKTGEINYCTIINSEEYITELGLDNSSAKVYRKGTLLMAMYGQGITRGKVAILGIDAAINQACAAISPKEEKQLLSEYLYYYLENNYERVRNHAHGANQKNLSSTLIKTIKIIYPSYIKEQKEIINTLKLIDRRIKNLLNKKVALSALFKTLLHELMTGQRRVHEIDFEKSELYKMVDTPLRLVAEKPK